MIVKKMKIKINWKKMKIRLSKIFKKKKIKMKNQMRRKKNKKFIKYKIKAIKFNLINNKY